jgi:prepilin peptidase CpaA
MAITVPAAAAAMSVFVFTMAAAGISDLTSFKISNGLMLAFLLAYAALAPFSGFAVHEIGWSAAAAAAVLLVAFIVFALGWIGGGDAKLAAVTALWVGADHTADYLLYTALFGGAFTLGLLMFRRLPLPAVFQGSPWVARLHLASSGVPYGVAMAVAGLVVFPGTHWMSSLVEASIPT